MKKIIALFTVFGISACAKSSNEIPAQYVSPLQYSGYNCRQIEMEMQAVSRRASELGGQVDKTASDDSAQMAVSLVLFWPTLFFLDGNTPQAAEYGRLKGEFEALERSAIQKNCSVHVEPIKVKRQEPKEGDSPAYPSGAKH